MADQTPTKIYPNNSTIIDLSACRLCQKTGDTSHSKNLFKSSVWKQTEELLAENIPNDSKLPHLVCRPCERKVTAFSAFKQMVKETQKSFKDVRVKRCLEMSPSVQRPAEKTRVSTIPGADVLDVLRPVSALLLRIELFHLTVFIILSTNPCQCLFVSCYRIEDKSTYIFQSCMPLS